MLTVFPQCSCLVTKDDGGKGDGRNNNPSKIFVTKGRNNCQPFFSSATKGQYGALAERVNLGHNSFEIIQKSMLAFFVVAQLQEMKSTGPPLPQLSKGAGGGYKRLKSVEINKKIVVSLFTSVAHLVFSPFDSQPNWCQPFSCLAQLLLSPNGHTPP